MLGVKSIREPIKGEFAKKILLEIVEKTLTDFNVEKNKKNKKNKNNSKNTVSVK